MRKVGVLAAVAVAVAGCGGSAMTTSSRHRLVSVPNVVGMRTARAKTVLKAQGLKVDVGWLNSGVRESGNERKPCVGLPGTGRTSDQFPFSGVGGRVPPGTVIHLKPGCPRKSALPRCPDQELKVRPSPDGGTGQVWVWVFIEHVAGPPCRLDGDLQLSIEKSGAPLPGFDNNPATVSVGRRLGLGETLVANWPQYGGCPTIRHATYVARFQSAVASVNESLVCGVDTGPPGLAAPHDIRFGGQITRRSYQRAVSGLHQ